MFRWIWSLSAVLQFLTGLRASTGSEWVGTEFWNLETCVCIIPIHVASQFIEERKGKTKKNWVIQNPPTEDTNVHNFASFRHNTPCICIKE